VIVYAESSAILAWLLGEPSQHAAIAALGAAERVASSTLTGLECARGLARAVSAGRITRTDELAALRLLDVAERSWDVIELGDDVLRRARASFPVAPVRTLGALHLATAALLRDETGAVAVLSFDERIRANVEAMGMALA
jgi:uncharacterized protein with PIN domain